MSCDTLDSVPSARVKQQAGQQHLQAKIKLWFHWLIIYLVKVLPISLANGFLNFLSWLTILTPYRCSRCNQCLPNWYFEKDGRLFCHEDYWAKFGDACNGCSDLITGPVMVAGEHRYHPECFKCVHCDAYIGDEETYALVERSKLFCGTCYTKVMKPLLAASPRRRKPHSIQLVEIPATPDGNRGVQFSMDRRRNSSRPSCNSDVYRKAPIVKITDLDVSPDLQGLKIGDRILEVNGLSVRDKSTEEMDVIFNNSTDVLHITLERDPSPLRSNSDSDSPSDTCTLSSPDEVLIGSTPVKLRPRSTLKARNFSPSRRRRL
ncbi:LIM domain kinase 1 [Patella vulgata]|uniref:LIM domain kinase 1 n=1 Tax=Patella vulgata TaxID=6465 RepID=UPI00217F7C01|nr:LIM domain kinase 1 [Patella vulgata]